MASHWLGGRHVGLAFWPPHRLFALEFFDGLILAVCSTPQSTIPYFVMPVYHYLVYVYTLSFL
jgi:hypothetical protein